MRVGQELVHLIADVDHLVPLGHVDLFPESQSLRYVTLEEVRLDGVDDLQRHC